MSLPPGITSIDDGVFEYCRSLTGVTIPAGVGRIGQFAFNGCNQLDAVVIPASVTEIGANAFAECKIIALNIPENVKTIGDYAFSDCDTQSIKIHSSETAMGTGVFASCGKLKAVDFPPGTREIAASTFASCHALQSLTIPPSVKRIDTSAFAYSGLKRIDLGSSLTRIGSDAFSHCSDLRMVTLPRSLKEVGDGAFEYCEKLLNVWFLGDAPAMGKLVFQRTTPDFVIYFAARSIDYTIPRWHGYRASLAKEEIEVQAADGSIVIDAQGFTRLGSTIVGETSRSKRFVIRNVGVLKLTGLHARISGGDSSDFIIKTLTKNSLAPGQTAILEILFQPKQRGKRSSQLHIMSSDANEDPFEVDLSAIGLQLIK